MQAGEEAGRTNREKITVTICQRIKPLGLEQNVQIPGFDSYYKRYSMK